MLILTIIGLAGILACNFYVGRSLLFPPCLFTGMWLINLGVLLVSDHLFYQVGDTACLVYLVGALSFSLGGVLVYARSECGSCARPTQLVLTGEARRDVRCALDLMLLLLIISLPYYFYIAKTLAGNVSAEFVLDAIRMREVSASGKSNPFGHFAGNLAILALLCAPAVYYESDSSVRWRIRITLSVLLALAYGFLSGSKEGVLVFLTLIFVAWLKTGRLRLRNLVVSLVLMLGLFSLGLVAINFVSQSQAGLEPIVTKVGSAILVYWLAGVVAFGKVANHPDVIHVTQNIWRFFLETARDLGVRVAEPSLHEPYAVVSAQPEIRQMGANTYTAYISYFPDFGWLGVVIIMASLGAAIASVWERARIGRPVYVLVYASLCVGIVLTFNGEHFLLGLNWYIKEFAIYGFLYAVIPRIGNSLRAIRAKEHARII